jgi:NAD(P)-dependent dehydrogenase (short-subunit alcohol dehydrogenase family)
LIRIVEPKKRTAMSKAKIVLVTGGNRGIGKEVVRQLAEQGHTVLLGSRSLVKGRAAAAEMQGDVHPVALDLEDQAGMAEVARFIEGKWGQLDAVINNAGVMSATDGPATQPVSELKRVLETNFFGIYLLNQVLLDLLRNSDDARIVNMSSGMGERGSLSGDHTAYRLSKYLLNGYTIMLAHQLGREGIQVNAMCPGWVKTDMGGAGAARSVDQGADTAVWLVTADNTPHGKFLRDRKVIPW